jgi:transcriptional regulator with XRE-family HTH domain
MAVIPPTFYSSLAAILRAWREHFGVSQEVIAAKVQVSSRAWRRWEVLGGKATIPSDENLGDISEATGIPYAVLMVLSAQRPIPIFYSLRRQMYSFDPDGLDETVNDYLARIHNPVHDQDLIATQASIRTERQVENIRRVQERFAMGHRSYCPKFMLACAAQLPELNVYLHDVWGHYNGHIMTALISPATSEQLCRGEINPMELTARDLRRSDQPFALFVMTMHASHSGVLMKLLRYYFLRLRAIHMAQGDRKCLAYYQSRQAGNVYETHGFDTVLVSSEKQSRLQYKPAIASTDLSKIIARVFG